MVRMRVYMHTLIQCGIYFDFTQFTSWQFLLSLLAKKLQFFVLHWFYLLRWQMEKLCYNANKIKYKITESNKIIRWYSDSYFIFRSYYVLLKLHGYSVIPSTQFSLFFCLFTWKLQFYKGYTLVTMQCDVRWGHPNEAVSMQNIFGTFTNACNTSQRFVLSRTEATTASWALRYGTMFVSIWVWWFFLSKVVVVHNRYTKRKILVGYYKISTVHKIFSFKTNLNEFLILLLLLFYIF